jgi:GT2 family glycosyltransferase
MYMSTVIKKKYMEDNSHVEANYTIYPKFKLRNAKYKWWLSVQVIIYFCFSLMLGFGIRAIVNFRINFQVVPFHIVTTENLAVSILFTFYFFFIWS